MRNPAGLVALSLCSCLIIASCDNHTNQYFPPPESKGGWRFDNTLGTIKSKGFDPRKLKLWAYWNKVLPNGTPYQSAMIIKDGWILNEAYSVYSKGRERRFRLASNGKSFALALLGDMFNEPPHADLNAESKLYDKRWLAEGFPLSDPLKEDITFEHLMRHETGLQPEIGTKYKNERGRHKTKNYQNWVFGRDNQFPLTAKVYFQPGQPVLDDLDEQWRGYSSIAFAHLGFVFKNVYEKPAHAVLEQKILEPLGIESNQYYDEPDADNELLWFTAGGLSMTMRDYARFAYLILNKGRWQNQQIIPENWVARLNESTHYPNWRSNHDGYFGKQYPKDMIRIFGSGANFAFIIPSLNLIAIHNGRHSRKIVNRIESKFLELLFDAYTGKKTWLNKTN